MNRHKNHQLKPDPVLKDFWHDNGRFADLFNQVLFQGETVIIPEFLTEQDTEESTIFYEQAHRRAKALRETDEYLSGMARTDRLRPVINLVIYYGEKAWDGPVSLCDMMDIPEAFEPFFNNQKINLLEAASLGTVDFKHEDNQDFFTIVNYFYKDNGNIDLKILKEKFADKAIYWETMAAIGAATGSDELMAYARQNKGGRLNMCTALENLKLEGIQEGKQQGMQQGMIAAYRELNIPDDVIVQKIRERFGTSDENVRKAIAQVSENLNKPD